MSGYTISVRIEPAFADLVSERPVEQIARKVLESEDVDAECELSVVITDDETVQDLNKRYRDRDEATDVLSFGLGLDTGADFATPPGTRRQLGEVVISFPTARRQAEQAGHEVLDELLHLLTHGILHILGYDHEQPDEAAAMRKKEESVLHG